MIRLISTEPVNDPNTRFMRLFPQDDTPPYAILSHRYDSKAGEVSFKHLNPGSETPTGRVSYKKITGFCNKAFDAGFKWAWVDTCCINHDDSEEQKRSINSMFEWYRKSEVCYAYLADVATGGDIRESEWFTRGWTLQELLAPGNLTFFDKNWIDIGSKAFLRNVIQEITNIPPAALLVNQSVEYSVAQIFSWTQGRETSRPEDVAYSLLGLLNINLPPNYGEGGKQAFIRLQQEIIKRSTDQSIFSWTGPPGNPDGLRDAFATTPSEFLTCADVSPNTTSREFALTNNGLRINMRINDANPDVIWGLLDCTRDGMHVAIPLEQVGDPTERRYARIGHHGPAGGEIGAADVTPAVFNEMEDREVYIAPTGPRNFNTTDWLPTDRLTQYTFFIEPSMTPNNHPDFRLIGSGTAQWVFGPGGLELRLKHSGSRGAMLLRHPLGGNQFVVMLGVHNWRVWTNIVPFNAAENLQDFSDTYVDTAAQHLREDVWNGLDEQEHHLGEGRLVAVKIRIGQMEGKACFRTRITFSVRNPNMQ
ncbi:Vegetative incompatibility protein HET-E-1 [Colletotrichum fructicola]|nr:Vegetative incompatibility protein HET-E-1 [Colletotrichum fructicola]KAF5483288.1 Vegetative incompatibility protein HET-E-1 [Colletotrichum fructicola]